MFNGETYLYEDNQIRADCFYEVNFHRAKFLGKVSFNNRNFKDETDFSDCLFFSAPGFHNCKIHQDTNFFNTIFTDVKSKNAVRAYRSLKLAMEQHHAREEQANFYALEQQSLRNQATTPNWVKWSTLFYEIVSDYGQSPIRPLLGLFLSTCIFYLVYSGNTDFSRRLLHSIDIWRFTIRQLIQPFSCPSSKLRLL